MGAMTLPCSTCPEIPCGHAGLCFGVTYWDGKPGKAKPLEQVEECKWIEKCREWYRRQR